MSHESYGMNIEDDTGSPLVPSPPPKLTFSPWMREEASLRPYFHL